MKKRQLKKLITYGKWQHFPGARFMRDKKRGITVHDHQMWSLGIAPYRAQAILGGE
jgi:hypothetical protein